MNDSGYKRASARAALLRTGRFVATAYCVIAATTACAHPNNTQAGSSLPAPTVSADSLLVDLDTARRITGVDSLASNPAGADVEPRSPKSQPPGPCRVFDARIAYGSNWTDFRSAVYNGFSYPPMRVAPGTESASPHTSGATATALPEPLMVLQSIGIYPDKAAARSAFEHLLPELNKCSALRAKHYAFTVDQPNSSTILLNYHINSETIYHVESSVLINVSTGGFHENRRITEAILQEIADRIT